LAERHRVKIKGRCASVPNFRVRVNGSSITSDIRASSWFGNQAADSGNQTMTGETHMKPMMSACGRLIAIALAATCARSAPALAQNDKMTPEPTPAQRNAIELGTGPLPGATAQESWHRQYGSLFARNVTVATLTPYLPDPSNASGAAVVVAPGGGFRVLSMENEGSDVAFWIDRHSR
jgi:hypothetical protein